MKNVLFTTTAVAALAFAGSAFAAGHSGMNFSISGSSNVGYNDDIEGGLFLENDIDFKAAADLGNGYEATAKFGADHEFSEAADNNEDGITFEGATLVTPVGTLSWDDNMDGSTAADEWYKDRDGMAIDVPGADGDAGIKWVGDFGDFGYAISTGQDDLDGDIPSNFTVGAGGSFGDVSVGLGYAEAPASGGDDTMAVSADFSVGDFGVGLSYADAGTSSIGVVADATFGDVGVNVYYAVNDGADDKYGVGVDFASGPFSIGIDFDTGEGAVQDSIEIDVEYAVNDDLTLYVGMDDAEAGDGLYAGVVAQINDGVKATVAYSDFDESGDPEFKTGTSAYLTITY